MSIHSSLHGADSLIGERSVLTRLERIEKLQQDERFDPDSESPFGLPKVRTKFRVKKKKKEETEEELLGEGAATDGEGEAEDSE